MALAPDSCHSEFAPPITRPSALRSSRERLCQGIWSTWHDSFSHRLTRCGRPLQRPRLRKIRGVRIGRIKIADGARLQPRKVRASRFRTFLRVVMSIFLLQSLPHHAQRACCVNANACSADRAQMTATSGSLAAEKTAESVAEARLT
jgi:hypothetical protein